MFIKLLNLKYMYVKLKQMEWRNVEMNDNIVSNQPYLRPVVTLIIYKDGKILLQ